MFIIELVLLCGFMGWATNRANDDDDNIPPGVRSEFDRHPAGSELSRRGFGTTVYHNYGGSP